LGGPNKYQPRDRILGQSVFACRAVIGNSVRQLKCPYNAASRVCFDRENDRLIVIVGKSVRLPNARGRTFSWQKRQMLLLSVHVEVKPSLLHGECLNEVHMVVKRRAAALWRQTNLVALACSAVLFLADPA